MMDFNWTLLNTEFFLVGLMLLVFLVDLFVSDKRIPAWLTIAGLVVLFFVNLWAPHYGSTLNGTLVHSSFTAFLKGVFLLAGIIASLGAVSTLRQFEKRAGEYYLLLLASLLGMMLVVMARELVLFFVAFELMSIPLYVLAAYDKADDRSVEAGLKLFIYGTFSSALLAMGVTLMYGVVGSTLFRDLASGLTQAEPLAILGLVLFLAGVGFKVAMVPFHMWVPDTYEGAPAPFVAFLSVAPKAAGFAILFVFLLSLFQDMAPFWKVTVAFFAGITMILGNLLALPQTNLKRLLGYSGIAHIGYMLLAVAAGTERAIAFVLFYFVSYVLSNMGAFLFAEVVRQNEGGETLEKLHGYAQRNPLLSLYMLVFLLSLGGIPFVMGFWAKLYVFLAAVQSGLVLLVFLGAVLTVVALFYYLNVARQMYIEKPEQAEKLQAPVRVPGSIHLALALATLAVAVLGLYPKLVVSPALSAAHTFLQTLAGF